MAKFGLLTLVAGCIATLTLVAGTSGDATAGKPCSRKKYETVLVDTACKTGGVDEAKKAMKDYLREAKKQNESLTCATCHSKVGGDYPLKPKGLATFREYGGK